MFYHLDTPTPRNNGSLTVVTDTEERLGFKCGVFINSTTVDICRPIFDFRATYWTPSESFFWNEGIVAATQQWELKIHFGRFTFQRTGLKTTLGSYWTPKQSYQTLVVWQLFFIIRYRLRNSFLFPRG